jgi:hypothetical protein
MVWRCLLRPVRCITYITPIIRRPSLLIRSSGQKRKAVATPTSALSNICTFHRRNPSQNSVNSKSPTRPEIAVIMTSITGPSKSRGVCAKRNGIMKSPLASFQEVKPVSMGFDPVATLPPVSPETISWSRQSGELHRLQFYPPRTGSLYSSIAASASWIKGRHPYFSAHLG